MRNVKNALLLIIIVFFCSCSQGETPQKADKSKTPPKVDINKSLEYRQEIERRGLKYDSDTFIKSIRSGNKEIVDYFIKSGYDLNAKNSDYLCPLQAAIFGKQYDIAIELLEKGADYLNSCQYGWEPWMNIIGSGDLPVIEQLMKSGFDVNYSVTKSGFGSNPQNPSVLTAYTFAKQIKNKEEVIALLKKYEWKLLFVISTSRASAFHKMPHLKGGCVLIFTT